MGEQFAERVERQLRKPARGAVLAELKRADIICTCTTNPAPLFVCIVALASSISGIASGLTSAGIAVIFSALFFLATTHLSLTSIGLGLSIGAVVRIPATIGAGPLSDRVGPRAAGRWAAGRARA